MTSRRMQRINQLLREELAELLQREIKDEVLTSSLISLTDVETSPDLRNARVFVSVYADDEAARAAVAHLNRAAGFLHRSLKGRVDLRTLPRLEFVLDSSLARGDRIMRLMRQIDLPPADEGHEEQDAGSAG